MICYYFYKNIVLVFTEIYFAFFNGYSGQIFFADWLPMLYNALWTSWNCLFAYVLEQDVNDEYIYKYPTLYKAGQKGVYFSFGIFWRWIIFSIWHGLVTFFGCSYGLKGIVNETGNTQEHWFISTVAFTLIIQTIIYKLFIETVYWNTLSIVTAILSVVLYYATLAIGSVSSIAMTF